MLNTLTGFDVEELELLDEVVKSRGWRIIRNIFNEHRVHCLEKSQECLKKHEDRKAGEWLAKSEEPNTLIALIQNRRNELSKKQEGDSNNGNNT